MKLLSKFSLVTLSMFLFLTACGSDKEKSDNATEKAEEKVEVEEKEEASSDSELGGVYSCMYEKGYNLDMSEEDLVELMEDNGFEDTFYEDTKVKTHRDIEEIGYTLTANLVYTNGEDDSEGFSKCYTYSAGDYSLEVDGDTFIITIFAGVHAVNNDVFVVNLSINQFNTTNYAGVSATYEFDTSTDEITFKEGDEILDDEELMEDLKPHIEDLNKYHRAEFKKIFGDDSKL